MIIRPRSIALITTALAITAAVLGGFAVLARPAAAATEVIVYETYGVYGGSGDIHSVNPDGTNDVNLTPDTPDSLELDPQVSPDGTSVAFVSNRATGDNADGNFEVFTMGIDGSNVTQVTDSVDPFGQGDYSSFNPTWSPDGARIAFDGYRTSYGASQIFVIDADGTDERQVTTSSDSANKWLPDWSPDGSKILFTWGWDYYSQDVRTIEPDGTGEENLTPDSVNSAQGSAVWSPDGARIAYSGDGTTPGTYPNPNREIFVMEYPSLLTTQVTEHEAVDESPSWSATGSEIVFTSPRDGKYALYVVAAPAVATPPADTTTFQVAGTRSVEDDSSFTTTRSTSSTSAEAPVRKLNPTTGNEADPFWATAGAPATHTLTVKRSGRGRVTSSPAGIACGTDCTEAYAEGTSVTLTARPGSGWTFSGWTGGRCGTAATCTVKMNAAKTVTAAFVKAGTVQTLTVTKTGRGRVVSSPAGIYCGTDCSESYATGTVVTLTAKPLDGSTFSGWSGACTGTATTCTVTMDAAKSVSAKFVATA